jgi:hypothetical protein
MNDSNSVFLSYGRMDARELAERLEADLKVRGFKVWRDVSRMGGAASWDGQIERAISGSDILLALMSPHATRRIGDSAGSTDDSVCLDEIAYARFGPAPIPIIPIMAVPTQPPLLLIRQQYLNFAGALGTPQYTEALDLLVDWIKTAIQTPHLAVSDPTGEIFDLESLVSYDAREYTGREWLDGQLLNWMETSTKRRLMLITGDPGIGKSSFFANFVSKNPRGHLVAYHACRQSRTDSLQAGRAVRSMALMLSKLSSSCHDRVELLSRPQSPLAPGEALSNPQRAFDDGLLRLFGEDLIRAPGVIFVDALDESLWTSGTSLAAVLANALDILPEGIRIAATSRNDPRVLDLFAGEKISQIDANSKENLLDLSRYVALRIQSRTTDPSSAGLIQTISGLANGNFLIAKLLADEADEVGNVNPSLPAEVATIAGEFARAFGRRFPPGFDYEPIRQVLGLSVAAFAPLPLTVAAKAAGGGDERRLLSTIEPVAPYILRRDGTLSPFHLSFSQWLSDKKNPYGIRLIEAHRSIVKAFAVQVEGLVSGRGGMDLSEKNYYSSYLLDHLAASSQFLDGEIPFEIFVALDLGMASRGDVSNWPSTQSIPKEFMRYASFVAQSRNAAAGALLIRVLHEIALNLYVESGLLKPRTWGEARFELTGTATEGSGAPVAKAFEVAAAAGALARLFCQARVFDAADAAKSSMLAVLAAQAEYAGGFEFAGWSHGISGYFEDAGGALYRELRQVINEIRR